MPSSPRTIHGMKSWPLGRASGSENGSASGGLGLGFGGAKEMLNCKEDLEEEGEEIEQVMRRGSARSGRRAREGLKSSEDDKW